MKRQILFVTYQNEDMEDGLSYAVDLAKAMDEGITILLVNRKKIIEKFSDVMAAVAFAEAGEHETAREILAERDESDSRRKLGLLMERCQESSVDVDVQAVTKDAVSAVNDFLKQKSGVDMVLLSPSITSNGEVTARELQKLVRTASRPIVTMARNVYAT